MSEIAPNSRGKPTERDIKEYHDRMKPAGEILVARQMQKDGWQVSPRTVGRCVLRGFAPTGKTTARPAGVPGAPPRETSPEINAINQVKSVAPDDAPPDLVAAAMVEALARLPDGARDRVKALLEMDDQDLENQTAKLVKVARYLLAEDLAQHTKMMMLIPDKCAKLYSVLGSSIAPVIQPPMVNAGPAVIDHNPNEPRRLSQSAQAIADFRAQRSRSAA